MKQPVKSVSVETFYRIIKIFLTDPCRRKKGRHKRHPLNGTLLPPSLQQLQSLFVALPSQQELCFPGEASKARKRKNQTSQCKVMGFKVANNSLLSTLSAPYTSP